MMPVDLKVERKVGSVSSFDVGIVFGMQVKMTVRCCCRLGQLVHVQLVHHAHHVQLAIDSRPHFQGYRAEVVL